MKTIKKIAILCSMIVLCMTISTVNAQHLEKDNISKEPRYSLPTINNNSPLSNEDCYCYYYSDFDDYYHYVNFFVLAEALSIRNQWHNEQKETIKKDLMDRMGFDTNYYHHYGDVQSTFFSDRFGKPVANYFLNNAKNSEISQRNQSLEDYNETYVTSEMFEMVQNSHLGGSVDDFGDLTHYNRRLRDMSYNEAYDLWNHKYGAENVGHQLDWQSHSARVNKINGMLNFPIHNQNYFDFITYIGNQFKNHVNSQSLFNHVSMMTGYMIYEWNLQYLYSRPNLSLTGLGYDFYYPYEYTTQITAEMNSNINNAPGHSSAFPYSNDSPEEIMRKYSMTKQNLGNLSGGFYEGKEALIDEGGKYQERDNYNYTRRNMLKSLAEYFLQDEPLISHNDWEGIQSLGQNSDRPEQLMNVKLSHDALSFGFRDFGSVFEVLGNYPELNAQKGALLRTYINENTPNNIDISSFTDADLGLIFDFDNRGIDYLGLQFSDYANNLILEIEHGDNIYGWSLFTDPFKVAALHALVDGAEVDFDKETIISSSVPECVKTIIKKMLNDNANIDLGDMPDFVKNELNLIGNIFNVFSNSPVYHLNFKVGPLEPNSLGQERSASTLFNITTKGFDITLNEDYVDNATDLAIARTIIHESVHAYISLIYHTQLFSELSQSLSHLLKQNGDNPNTAEHILMTQNFVDAIANSLESWDDSSLPDNSYYYFMSWSGGMVGTPAYNYLNSSIQTNIVNANTNEGQVSSSANSNALGTKNCN